MSTRALSGPDQAIAAVGREESGSPILAAAELPGWAARGAPERSASPSWWRVLARAAGGSLQDAYVALATLALAPPTLSGPAPAFYAPPEWLGPGGPGELVRAEPMQAQLAPGVRLRAGSWRILYRSTSATGEPTLVSGTILLPTGHPKPVRPLVGFAVGTHGMSDGAAPSRLLARGLDHEATLIAMVLSHGWAVAITDYQGLGTPGDHPYLVGRALGPNVLDAMRAARALHPGELPADGPAAIIGYSEGGVAAAWAAQLQRDYAPEINLRGVVAGAAVTDPESAARHVDGGFFSFLAGYGAIGFAAAYPDLDLESHLTPGGRRTLRALRETSVLEAVLRGPHFIRASELTRPSVFELAPWRRRLGENRLGDLPPAAPVLIHHARHDQVVPFTHAEQLDREWRRRGVDVRMYATPGTRDHLTAGVVGTRVGLRWLASRLESRRSPCTQTAAHGTRAVGAAA
jgi:hypothetical protein